jgi:hypothetical protein
MQIPVKVSLPMASGETSVLTVSLFEPSEESFFRERDLFDAAFDSMNLKSVSASSFSEPWKLPVIQEWQIWVLKSEIWSSRPEAGPPVDARFCLCKYSIRSDTEQRTTLPRSDRAAASIEAPGTGTVFGAETSQGEPHFNLKERTNHL